MTQTDAMLKEWLLGAIETGGPYDPAATWAGVATAVVDHGKNTVMADVTPAPGGLGTRVPVVAWSVPYKLGDGRWAADGPEMRFRPASVADQAQLTHWFLAGALVAGTLKAFAPVEGASNLIDENSMFSLVVRLTIDPDGRFDASVMWNG